LLKQGFLLKI